MVIAIICFIAAIVYSVYGIFVSSEDSGTGLTMCSVVQEINADFEAQIDAAINAEEYDVLETSGSKAAWKEVLAVYAVKVNTDPNKPQEVATMDEGKQRTLKDIFWQMNAISSYTEDHSETVVVEHELENPWLEGWQFEVRLADADAGSGKIFTTDENGNLITGLLRKSSSVPYLVQEVGYPEDMPAEEREKYELDDTVYTVFVESEKTAVKDILGNELIWTNTYFNRTVVSNSLTAGTSRASDVAYSKEPYDLVIPKGKIQGTLKVVGKEVEETTHTETYLYITTSHKSVDEMAEQYGFSQTQKDYLSELLDEKNDSLWAAVLKDIDMGEE